MKLSAVIICKDAESTIEKCIKSCLSVTDDVVVYDSGSTDATIEILNAHPIRLFQGPWLGYSPTKNEANRYAAFDYILSLDADEYLDDDLIRTLTSLGNPQNPTIYYCNRLSRYDGRWIKHSGWHPQWIARIFPKDKVSWDERVVHEQLHSNHSMEKIRLNGLIMHETYSSSEQFRKKMEDYGRLKAEEWHRSGQKPGLINLWLAGPIRFAAAYFFKGGFMDGRQGWEIARMEAYMARTAATSYKQLKK